MICSRRTQVSRKVRALPGAPGMLEAGRNRLFLEIMRQERHATLLDVARYAGVGTTTVSRVINGSVGVSPKTLAAVRQAIKDLGFAPNPVARMLKGEQTKTIGLIIPNLADSYFSSIAEEIQKVACSFGSMVIVTVTHNEVEREWVSVNELARRTDGLLLAPASSMNPKLVERLSWAPIPVVCFDRPLFHSNTSRVLTANYQDAKAATKHLLSHGRERILCLGGEASFHTVHERLRGYLAAMEQAGRGPLVDVSEHKRGAGEAAKVLKKHFRGKEPPDAIFCLKNSVTIDCYDFLQRFGIAVPMEVALVGFDDFRLAAMLRPSVTVVRQPVEEIGRTAAEMLFKRLGEINDAVRAGERAAPRAGELVRLKNELIVRASCGCEEVPVQRLGSLRR